MTHHALLAVSALLIGAYLLDLLGRRFRLPSVVLLIATGMITRQVLDRSGIVFDGLDPLVSILGTLGLILIVLEGALDLVVTRERAGMIARAGAASVAGVLGCTAAFALLFHFLLGVPGYASVLAAIPFAVISSAVAIPSATGLPHDAREFVIYESSFSDIVGVLLFYAALYSQGDLGVFALDLFGGGAASVAVALVASLGLYAFLHKVEGHVRFLPLLAGIVCLYAIGKVLHLSPLVVVLVAGLVIGNPQLLDRWEALRKLHSPVYDVTLKEFKGLVAELTFAVKSIFFLLLGYWTDVASLAEPLAWAIAATCVGFVYVFRRGLLRALRVTHAPSLTWIAPRGLITVLLFLVAMQHDELGAFPFGALMLTVLATSILVALAHADRDVRHAALVASTTHDPPAPGAPSGPAAAAPQSPTVAPAPAGDLDSRPAS